MSAVRRWLAPALALTGVTLVALWVAALPHRTPVVGVVEQRPAAQAAPLEGTAVPAGQQRYYAGETATLPGGATLTVTGPRVGVPAGSAAKLPEDALIPVAFTIRLTAGTTPVTVRPADFSAQIEGARAVPAAIFGTVTAATTLTQGGVAAAIPTLGSAAPVTVLAGATRTLEIPLRIIARTGYVVFAPGGVTQVSWIFTAEDD